MSLSRPVKFPLLKLPFLCIECVIKTWDILDIIFFAVVSQKIRRIVKHLKIPLNGIKIYLSARKWIELGFVFRKWNFRNEREPKSIFEAYKNLKKNPLVLQKNAIPLYTIRTDVSLESFCKENEITALKMAMEFLNEVFKCSVERVDIDRDNFPESRDSFDYAQSRKLDLLLENLEVTGTCRFWIRNTGKDFYVNPKLFNCKQLLFSGSAAWVTKEIIMQFEVPQLTFFECPFSVEDIVSFVTQWFHSDNKKLELLYIPFLDRQISLESFQTEALNPISFSGRTRVPPTTEDMDYSKGLEIVRHDGLVATIHVKGTDFLFYIWHNQ
ncbi:unnamed protein product [Caenorhabditis brenneri]